MRVSLAAAASALLLAACAGGSGSLPGNSSPGQAPRAPGVRHTSLGTEVLASKAEAVTPRLVGGEPAAAYVVVADAFRALRLDVAGQDDRAMLVESERMVLRGTLGGAPVANFLDCGITAGGRSANVHRVELRVRAAVSSGPAGAQLATEVEGIATNPTTSSPPVRCASTGLLEDRLAERVRALLAGGASPE